MKKFRYLLLIMLILPCFMLTGCFGEKHITDIAPGEKTGPTTTYTITYSDGTTSSFSVTDGENGDNGENITLETIKKYCEDNNLDFKTFLQESIGSNLNPVKSATNIAMNSAVTIVTTYPCASTFHQSTKSISAGAGVIYSMDKSENGYSYVLTNHHVVKCSTTSTKIANEIGIFQYGHGGEFSEIEYYNSYSSCCYAKLEFSNYASMGEYIGGSESYDIAVLKVKTSDLLDKNPNACAIKCATSYELGESAITIGNPSGDGFSVTEGIVSVMSEFVKTESMYTMRAMRIDTPVNAGNSGGGLYNIYGELIGVVNAKIEDSKIDNIAYAIPIDAVTKVANNVIENYKTTPVKATKLYLGIKYLTQDSRTIYNVETDTLSIIDTLYVSSVNENSIAESMGLQSGDIITKIQINNNMFDIKRSFQLGDILLDVRVGDTVKFFGTRQNTNNSTLGVIENVSAEQLVSADSALFQ